MFALIIDNLGSISEGNATKIINEEKYAEKRLAVEIGERDIYQKKRVCMDVQVEI
jgi:predicted RNase H-like nuclease (RuvC/YqgF family)